MRLLVCGSRDFESEVLVRQMIYNYYTTYLLLPDRREFTVIEGGAKGADSHAANYIDQLAANASEFKTTSGVFAHEQYPADWEKYGKAAGPIRNKQMLEEGKPDYVLAFTNKPLDQSKGTKNMVEQAEKAGIPIVILETR